MAIDPSCAVLCDIVKKYKGIHANLEQLLYEIHHPFRNWTLILPRLRAFVLKNFNRYYQHRDGPEAFGRFCDIFLSAIDSPIKQPSGEKETAMEALLAYIEKLVSRLDRNGPAGYESALAACFSRLVALDDDVTMYMVQSRYCMKKICALLLKTSRQARSTNKTGYDLKPAARLLKKTLFLNYRYWLSEEDPLPWLSDQCGDMCRGWEAGRLFNRISHQRLKEHSDSLKRIKIEADSNGEEPLALLLELPSHPDIVRLYREVSEKLVETSLEDDTGDRFAENRRLLFLFRIMDTSGLFLIHEETLREINQGLVHLIQKQKFEEIERFLLTAFQLLKANVKKYPHTSLQCIQVAGTEIFDRGNSRLVETFLWETTRFGFQHANVIGVTRDWQPIINPAHLGNIRVWLSLIMHEPKWCATLFSALIINIKLSGTCVKDTDLFQRDITELLNHPVEPVYNLVKQFARLMPVFFNEIGAEGILREVSTELDEIHKRRDPLIHFLRKQSHVESSNRIIDLMEATFNFWETKEKDSLELLVPPDIYQEIHIKGPYIDGVHRVISHLKEKGVSLPDGLITIKDDQIKRLVEGVSGVSEQDSRRVELAVNFYKLLNQKYNLDFIEMENYLAQLRSEAFPDLGRLQKALAEPDLTKKIFGLLDYLEALKKIILSDQKYEIKEDIYKKRHITIDIPSMYGSYREMKFDALGLTFRIESLVNVFFEELVENVDLSLITKATFFQIYDWFRLFYKALKLDGTPSVEIELQLDMLAHSLEARRFTFTQYLDIFKGFAQAARNIINDYFNNIHGENLSQILSQISFDQILPKYLPQSGAIDHEKLKHRVSEIFFRERIAFSLALQQLDLLLSRILNTLFQQSNKLPKDKLQDLLLYDPEKAMTSMNNVPNRVSGIIYLGNKGLNLVRLKNLGLPVPPGFIITTETFRSREIIDNYPPAKQNFREQLEKHIADLEKVTGKIFGDPNNPLLFSVRSGSSISQPGMMDTFLNVGMNEEIAAGIAERTGNAWFAWDCYRRFLQCYGMAFGLERDDFDAIIGEMKRRAGIGFKREFDGMQMQKVAMTYKSMIKNSGIDVIDDPFEQFYVTIKNVFGSWESSKARAYRKIMGISDDWGTAATVQEMVYGNLSRQSGAGIIFTHNPRWSEDSLRLWGDFTIGNQGEDVASGLVATLPISIIQQDVEMRETDITLETHFPEIYNALKEWTNELIHMKGWSPQEMEFTFEGPGIEDLYLLQCRDMTIRERKKVSTFDLGNITEDKLLGHGIGVSGGAMSGRIVFSLKEIDQWRTIEPETYLVLVRNDTVPDDIREIYAADGLLTARGGVTSHAAVVAYRLGKTCIVGCGNLVCQEKDKSCRFNEVVFKSGDHISIDGREGSVYQDLIKVKQA